jgi:hypothetical protein
LDRSKSKAIRAAEVNSRSQSLHGIEIARYHMDASNMDAMNALVAKVRNTLARQKGLANEARGDAKAWRVAA